MAFLEERNGRFQVAFRYAGKLYRHNLAAADRVEAEGIMARVEENLRLLARGRLTPPPGADLATLLRAYPSRPLGPRNPRPSTHLLG